MIVIDKHKIYESHGFKFKNFVVLSNEEKLMILEWRNDDKVRNVMVNKDIIRLEDHLRFIDALNEREDCYYWLVFDESNMPVGVLDVIHVDTIKDQGEIGYYINPNESGKGFMFMIECLYFVFGQLQLSNNLSTVNINNKDILLFNKYIGASFEAIEKIGDEYFYVNRHSRGGNILERYEDFNLIDYAKFVKKHRKETIVFNV